MSHNFGTDARHFEAVLRFEATGWWVLGPVGLPDSSPEAMGVLEGRKGGRGAKGMSHPYGAALGPLWGLQDAPL